MTTPSKLAPWVTLSVDTQSGIVPHAEAKVWRDGTKWCGIGRIKVGGNYWYVSFASDTCDIAKDLIKFIEAQEPTGVGFLDFVTDAIKGAAHVVASLPKSAVNTVKDVADFAQHPDHFKKYVENAVNSIAKSDIIKGIGAGLSEIANNPYIAGAINIAAIAIPGAQPALGAAYLAFKAAYKVADGVVHGDPASIAKAASIATQAMDGTPAAREAASMIATAIASPDKIKAAMLAAAPSMATDLSASIPGASAIVTRANQLKAAQAAYQAQQAKG